MKEIPLSQGKVTLVDDTDYEWLTQRNWWVVQAGDTWYAVTDTKKPEKHRVRMHRLIMIPPFGMEVDHIDGNGLNNQRSNLRICTRNDNVRNTKRPITNTSGYKGVAASVPNRWRSYINVNNKQIYIGSYKTPEEAARAYDAKAIELFGEFARLNFPTA